MRKLISFAAAIAVLLSICLVPVSAEGEGAAEGTLHTEGNQLVDASGAAVRLIGLNVPYMSWSDNCEAEVMNAVDISINEWEGNAVAEAMKT